MATGLWYTHVPNFGSLYLDFEGPLSTHLGLWRMLEGPDWDLASWSCLDIVTGLWYTHDRNFCSLSLCLRCKEHPCPLSPHLGLRRMLEVPDWSLVSWSWFGYDLWSLIHPWSEFWLSILILKVQRTSMSWKSSFGAFEDAGGSWVGFGILNLFGYGLWSLIYPWSVFLLSILIMKVQRTSMSFKSSFGAAEDAAGSWLGFGIFIVIWIWSLVLDIPMIGILALCLDFEGAKNIYVL